MKGGYWIQPATATYAPTCVVALVTADRRIPSANRRDRHYSTAAGVAVAASRRRRGRWSAPCREWFPDPAAVHDWLERWGHQRQRTYVVSPVASDALTKTEFWPRLTLAGCRWDGSRGAGNEPAPLNQTSAAYIVQTMVLRGNPDVVRYARGGRGFCWLSGRQYFDLADADLAGAVSYLWPRCAACGAGDGDPCACAGRRAGLWLHAMQSLCDWWGAVQGGPFGFTAGGLALNFFRSRLAKKTVLAHANAYAKRVEALAIHGGRAAVWFLGNVVPPGRVAADVAELPRVPAKGMVRGPLALYDVRSMYPWLLGDRAYPTRLQDVWENPAVEWVRDALKESCVIARVELDARDPEYPFRHRTGILYPTGTFTATLAGPELERAISRGEVRAVKLALCYAAGRPFKRMADDLLRMRCLARAAGNAGWEYFIKLLSNAFSGKLAQRKGQWERRPDVLPETPWGEFVRLDADGATAHRYRAMADLVWEYQELEDQGRPMGAAYAYLTAYGRDLMRRARSALPPSSVVAQDTDGVWVLEAACGGRAAELLDAADAPGRFSRRRLVSAARFFSPKHYVADGKWTLSGYHAPAVAADGSTITDVRSFNPILGCPVCPPMHTTEVTRTTPMVAATVPGVVTDAGWVVPAAVRAGRLVAPATPSAAASPAPATALSDL